ncbi:MAG: bifunctional ornithine acetyltransferase/N-acetylglutamate synthase [Clostridia bacterium]|nr:bifunctional ornithine acetyltransferase/N-acetylglutamate synthase [Clostridia bacterium]
MSVNIIKDVKGGVCAPKGFLAGGVHCGIRKNHAKKDLAIILSVTECNSAAVYTQNKVFGAPIEVTREHLKNGMARAIICNSGNANTCNFDGVEKAHLTCRAAARMLGLDEDDVIIASTGVIGQKIDLAPIYSGIEMLKGNLTPDGSEDAAMAIMTTDTRIKQTAVQFDIGGQTVTIGGIAKGSGMININMATMLSFITTDANITTEMLQKALKIVVADTYNMVSVDGDTSTNDMAAIMANGLARNELIDAEGEAFDAFVEGLLTVGEYMARLIARDGEGATKLLECNVQSAPDEDTAKRVAKAVVMSNLVKAAMFGCDANWGRVLCAIGYTPGNFNVHLIDVTISSKIGTCSVCKNGYGLDFYEDMAKKVLSADEITINVFMNQGKCQARAWGCDLTYDYVKINGDYRT